VVGREIEHSQDIKPGDVISASGARSRGRPRLRDLEPQEGRQGEGLGKPGRALSKGEVFGVSAFDANKGGLLIEVDGIRGFLPVSQLSAENYPA
jgi:small subunit ribosomal protein S1